MKNVALAFWGLTRSLKYTLPSIIKNIIGPLKKNNINYTIFMHTYSHKNLYTNKWAGEYNIRLNNNEYKLLNPNNVIVDDHDTVKQLLQLNKYRTHKDAWNTGYATLDNFILAMYSKSKVTEMIDSSFDTIIYLRPDMLYKTELNINWTHSSKTINIPNFNLFFNFNDQFCICNQSTYKEYGNIYDTLYSYSKLAPLHSEYVYSQYLKSKYININYIPFIFNRIRATGVEIKNHIPKVTHKTNNFRIRAGVEIKNHIPHKTNNFNKLSFTKMK